MTLVVISKACEKPDRQALYNSMKAKHVGLLQTCIVTTTHTCGGPATAETQDLGLPSNGVQKLLIWP